MAANADGEVCLTEVFSNRMLEFPADHALFTHPLNGEPDVTAIRSRSRQRPQRKPYILVAGTTPIGTDLLMSTNLQGSATSVSVPYLPIGKVLYATLLTE